MDGRRVGNGFLGYLDVEEVLGVVMIRGEVVGGNDKVGVDFIFLWLFVEFMYVGFVVELVVEVIVWIVVGCLGVGVFNLFVEEFGICVVFVNELFLKFIGGVIVVVIFSWMIEFEVVVRIFLFVDKMVEGEWEVILFRVVELIVFGFLVVFDDKIGIVVWVLWLLLIGFEINVVLVFEGDRVWVMVCGDVCIFGVDERGRDVIVEKVLVTGEIELDFLGVFVFWVWVIWEMIDVFWGEVLGEVGVDCFVGFFVVGILEMMIEVVMLGVIVDIIFMVFRVVLWLVEIENNFIVDWVVWFFLEGVGEKFLILSEVDIFGEVFFGVVWLFVVEEVIVVFIKVVFVIKVVFIIKEVGVIVCDFSVVVVVWVWWVWKMVDVVLGEELVVGDIDCFLGFFDVEIIEVVWGMIFVMENDVFFEVFRVVSGLDGIVYSFVVVVVVWVVLLFLEGVWVKIVILFVVDVFWGIFFEGECLFGLNEEVVDVVVLMMLVMEEIKFMVWVFCVVCLFWVWFIWEIVEDFRGEVLIESGVDRFVGFVVMVSWEVCSFSMDEGDADVIVLMVWVILEFVVLIWVLLVVFVFCVYWVWEIIIVVFWGDVFW